MSHEPGFYERKSWGSVAVKPAKDLPTLKLRYLMELLAKRKKKDAKVLEIGSGSGRILSTLHFYEPRLQLTGVDISAKQVQLAKMDNPDIEFVIGDAEDLPFRTGTFDYVVFLDVIEHVKHPDELLREAARVLKKGGHLYGMSPCEGQGIYKVSTLITGRHIKEQTAGHIQQFTITDLLDRVRRQKLKIVQTKYSYHLLGSIMDYTMFTLLLNERFAKLFWEKNKYYRNRRTKQSFASKVMNGVLTFANGIAYYESDFLQDTPTFATAVHVIARK